jgi:hypothetical protein
MTEGIETRVMSRIFGPNRVEIIEGWTKLLNEGFQDLYSSPNIIRIIKSRRISWAGYVAQMRMKRSVHRVLAGKPEGKRLRGRPSSGWEFNIKMELREIGWGDMNWIHLAQNRDLWRALVNTVINLWVQ